MQVYIHTHTHTWQEEGLGEQGQPEDVRKKQPKQIKKKRAITAEDGTTTGWEEYFDYIFPDETNTQVLGLLYVWLFCLSECIFLCVCVYTC